jgi:hypothetical protein
MAIMTILTKDIAANLQNYISLAVTGLLISVGFHFLRLTSFKMTPMEIKPLRDGRLRVHYLNRGKNHFKRSFIGIRLKESYVTIDSNKQLSYKSAIIHEDRYRLDSLTRPLDHLNEVVIPWPLIEGIEYPSTYQNESQGYMWELFLAVPGLVLGDYNEIKWPIQVDWEQLHTSPPSPHELEEEKLELRELADNRLKR